jgi:hypothetical protein
MIAGRRQGHLRASEEVGALQITGTHPVRDRGWIDCDRTSGTGTMHGLLGVVNVIVLAVGLMPVECDAVSVIVRDVGYARSRSHFLGQNDRMIRHLPRRCGVWVC